MISNLKHLTNDAVIRAIQIAQHKSNSKIGNTKIWEVDSNAEYFDRLCFGSIFLVSCSEPFVR